MNKGIKIATGDVVGILNADDVFAADDILSSVARAFALNDTDIIYGNLEYVNLQQRIIRKWHSGEYKNGMFNWGWMPPHPTFYCKRAFFESLGPYNQQYGTAADFELMLRFMHLNKLTACYLNKTMVKMDLGGVSNESYLSRFKAWKYDYQAMDNNGVVSPFLGVIFKPLRKILQYL